MSKSAAGVTRDKRLKIIRQLLHRWGRMTKEQIDEHLSSALECDNDAGFKRSLYRDLEYLVNEGDIVDYRFTSDGLPITEYDPSKHKNTRVQWAVAGEENQVLGGSILEQVKGGFQASKILTRDFAIEKGKPAGTNFQTLQLFFSLGHEFLCLKFNLSAASAKIIVRRTPDDEKKGPTLEDLEKTFGKRLGILSLPIPSLSSVKSPEKAGHFLIHVETPEKISIQDLGSSNGTSFTKITMADVDEMRKKGSLLGDNTVTSSWYSPKSTSFQFQDSGPLAQSLPLPVLIKASDKFRMLIV